jgi:hypothetical protein
MGAAVLLADGAGLFFRFPLQGIDLGSATAHPASSGVWVTISFFIGIAPFLVQCILKRLTQGHPT